MDNYITLACNHKFNYKAIYDETCNQKKYNFLDVAPSKIDQIKCPYCRSVTHNILPYFRIYNVEKIRGVTVPSQYSLKLHNCEYIYRSGKSKDTKCNNSAFICKSGTFCNTHYKDTPAPDTPTNDDNEKIYKKYTVAQLKHILKANKCKIGGIKSELIKRICFEKALKSAGWVDML